MCFRKASFLGCYLPFYLFHPFNRDPSIHTMLSHWDSGHKALSLFQELQLSTPPSLHTRMGEEGPHVLQAHSQPRARLWA